MPHEINPAPDSMKPDQLLTPIEQIRSLLNPSLVDERWLAKDHKILLALTELSKYGKLESSTKREEGLALLRLIPPLFKAESGSGIVLCDLNQRVASAVVSCLRSYGEEGIDFCIEFLGSRRQSSIAPQHCSNLDRELYRFLIENHWLAVPKLDRMLTLNSRNYDIDVVTLGVVAHIDAPDTESHGLIRRVLDCAVNSFDIAAIRVCLDALLRAGEVPGTGELFRKLFYLTERRPSAYFSGLIRPLAAVLFSGQEAKKCIPELRALISDGGYAWDVGEALYDGKEWFSDLVTQSSDDATETNYFSLEQDGGEEELCRDFLRDESPSDVCDQVLAVLTVGQLGEDASDALPELNLILINENCPEILKVSAMWAYSAIEGRLGDDMDELLELHTSSDPMTQTVLADLKKLSEASQSSGILKRLFVQDLSTLEIGNSAEHFKALELVKAYLDSDPPRNPYELVPGHYKAGSNALSGLTAEMVSGLCVEMIAFGTERAADRVSDYLFVSGHSASAIRKVYNLCQERIKGSVTIEEPRIAMLCRALLSVGANAFPLAPLVAEIVPSFESSSDQYWVCALLAAIGPRALPQIRALCSHEEVHVRASSYRSLDHFPMVSSELIAILRAGLSDENKFVRLASLEAISSLPNSPPRLSAFFDERRMIYGPAARILGMYGAVVAEGRFRLGHLKYLVPTYRSMRGLAIKWLDEQRNVFSRNDGQMT